ncbi:MAG: HYR domain-containing protein [Bacteroidia bacterium]|nr:HYR domain-containing protein [Bacteroidia bacterium]
MINKLLFFLCLYFIPFSYVWSQTYTMSNTTVNTCSGTFYDPGGTGNYGNSQNFTMTFCSSTPGQQIFFTFTSFQTEASFDYLYIYNGPNTGSPLIGSYTGATSPGTVTSTTGCLTFVFTSDGSITNSGWTATISCGTPPPPPPGPGPNCASAAQLCGVASYNPPDNATNQGTLACMGSTYDQSWYYFSPQNTGPLTLTISSNCDVDFAMWGPFATPPTPAICGSLGATLDCSFSAAATEFADIANAIAGQYYILVVSNFCRNSSNISISPNVPMNCGCTLSATAVAGSILCNGGTTSITVTPNPAGSYNYSLNGGPTQTSNVFSSVGAGNYTVTLVSTSNPACSTTTSVNVTQPALLNASAVGIAPACSGGTGSVAVTAAGGTAPLQYSLNGGPFQLASTFTGIAPGNYTVTIQDANGCSTTASAAVPAAPLLLEVTISATPITCFGGISTITANATGGVPPYQFNLNGGLNQPSGIFNGVTAGAYTINVTDNNGCVASLSFSVSQPPQLVANAVSSAISCFGGTSDITVTASGGTPGYQYGINGGGLQASSVFTGIPAGNHTILVQDASGCQTSFSINVTEPAQLTASVAASSILCNGGLSDITVTATGGTGVLQYSLNGGAYQAGNVFTGNVAGNYTVSVQDANGCTISVPVSVTQPLPLITSLSSTPVLCFGGVADLSVSVSGGTAPYQYALNGGASQGGNLFTGLPAGTYSVIVSDLNGCSDTLSTVITEPAPMSAGNTATDANCFGINDGTINVSASGGTLPYTYILTPPGQATGVFNGLFAGTYTITVQDSNNCTVTTTAQINEPPVLGVSNISELCNISGTAFTVTFDVSGGTPPYNISGVTGTFTGNTFTSSAIPTGNTPVISVSDANNCGPVIVNTVGNCVPAQACNTVTGCFLGNLIADGDFENFNPSNPFANFTSSYDYYDCDAGNSLCINGTTGQNILCQYDFAVETGTPACNNTWSPNIADHTSGTGNMMLVDFPVGLSAPIWCSTFTLAPNTDYCFGAYFLNLVPANTGFPSPVFRFEANGQVLAVSSIIPEDEQWHYEGVQFNSSAGGSVTLCIFNDNFGATGFDLAIDDISLREVTNGVPPVAVDDNTLICDNLSSVTLNVLNNDTGTNIDPATLQLISYPAFSTGNATADPTTGTVTFVPDSSFTGSASFTYNITTTDGCSDVATITVTEVGHPNPVINPGVPNPVCPGTTLIMDAGGGYTSYSWSSFSTGISDTTQTVSATVSDSYSVVVSDANGCLGGDTLSVLFSDIVPPVIQGCPSSISVSTDPGVCGAVINWTAPSVTDNCSAAILQTQGAVSGSLFPTGTSVIEYTATDAGGNTAVCQFSITVNDTELPVISGCPASITQPSDPGQCTAVVNWVSPSTSDNCSASLAQTQGLSSGSAFPIGTSTIVYTSTDASGNTATCQFSVTVTDNQPPVLTNCPSNISQFNDPNICGAAVTWVAPGATDNCSVTVTQTGGLSSGSVFPIGLSTVAYTATDAAGNTATCQFTITIIDNQAPVIQNCPANISIANNPGQCGGTASWTLPGVSDNCPGAVLIQTAGAASGSVFPLGTTTVSYQVTDASGNTATCQFTVTVTDSQVPTIVCPSNLILNTSNTSCTAIGNWITPSVNDNCPGAAVTQISGPASGSSFPLGVTTIGYLATDAAGNTASCQFTVTVNDGVAPVILNCPSNISVASDPGQCGAVVNWVTPTASDNCNAVTLTQTSGPSNATFFSTGTSTIAYIATDAAGNTASCQFTVTVSDNENPVIPACPSNITQSAQNGCSAAVSWTTPTATDNCPGVTITGNYTSGDIFPVGVTTVTYTTTDVAGNTALCSFNITVTPPAPLAISTSVTDVSCNGSNDGEVTATVSGGSGNYVYSWSTSPAQSGATATGLGAGSYTVFVSDAVAGACVQSVNAVVNINEPAPLAATAVSIADANCGSNEGIASVSVTGGSMSYSYTWNTAPLQFTQTATGLTTGTYIVTISDNNSLSCTTTASVTITGATSPVAGIAPTGPLSICEGSITTLTASGGNSYLWLYNSNPVGFGSTLDASGAGSYRAIVYTGSNLDGCADTSVVVMLSLLQSPQALIESNGPTAVCQGEVITLKASGDGTYLWLKDGVSTGETGNEITATENASYTLIVTNGCGSDTSANMLAQFYNLPVADFMYMPGPATEGENVLFTDRSITGALWNWNFGDGTGVSLAQNPVYMYNTAGDYPVTLWITDANGCMDSVNIIVNVVPKGPEFVPNIFSPNDDGIHDFLVVEYGFIELELFEIFDRWGKRVFITEDPSKYWNGNNLNGTQCADGAYYYVITGKDIQGRKVVRKGNVMLMR